MRYPDKRYIAGLVIALVAGASTAIGITLGDEPAPASHVADPALEPVAAPPGVNPITGVAETALLPPTIFVSNTAGETVGLVHKEDYLAFVNYPGSTNTVPVYSLTDPTVQVGVLGESGFQPL